MNRIKQILALWHLKRFLKANKTGWVITQRGNEYSIEPIKRDETGAYETIGTEETVEDNAGLMHNLHGVPLGLRVDDQRPIVDVLAAQVGKEVAHKLPDGGEIKEGEQFTIQQLEDMLLVGKFRTDAGLIHYLNPFVTVDGDSIVDLRHVAKLFQHDSDPDAPRKAAANAIEAERAVSQSKYGEIMKYGMLLGAVLIGFGLASYSGGGGGGNSSIDLGVGMISLWAGL
jgi:hypothetical protein